MVDQLLQHLSSKSLDEYIKVCRDMYLVHYSPEFLVPTEWMWWCLEGHEKLRDMLTSLVVFELRVKENLSDLERGNYSKASRRALDFYGRELNKHLPNYTSARAFMLQGSPRHKQVAEAILRFS